MNTTIAVRRMVPCIASQISALVSRLDIAASNKAPTTPMAPASVGVAIAVLCPGKPPIEPSTVKINTADGMMPRKAFFHNAQPSKVRSLRGMAGK